jgi:hypothetical protein
MKGLNKFLRQVRKKPKQVETQVDQELARSSLRVERGSKMLAPWDTGWMSNNIYSDKEGKLRFRVVSPANYSV